MADEHFYAVIMAGGGGTRLWPISRRKKPKQMLDLLGEKSLFQMCLSNLEGLIPPERILVITAVEQAEQLQALAPDIPRENYYLEPQPKGNAAAVGLASVFLHRRDPQAVTAILAADIIFQNPEGFRSLLRSAQKAALGGYLVTLGIDPTYPATGYGYIERGISLDLNLDHPANEVLHYKEKPDFDQAERMIADGRHVWNSGLFIWQVDRVLSEFQRNMPDLFGILDQILIDTPENVPEPGSFQQLWQGIQPQTIDFGIMEKAQDVAVLSATGLGWNDIGCWDSLFEVLPVDDAGNIIKGENIFSNQNMDSLLFSERKRPVIAIGLENILVIDGEGALLVCARDQSQQVKTVVTILKDTHHEESL